MNSLIFAGGQLIDGTGDAPVANGAVVVEGGRVVSAGPAARLPRPRGGRVVDVGGLTILPGLIDTHVHATYRARDVREHVLNPPTYNLFRSLPILRAVLESGVTTVRDMGGADTGFRRAVEEGLVLGPRLLVSIVMISQTGGHGDALLPFGQRLQKRAWLPRNVADGVDEVRKLVRQTLAAGADFIKVCAGGGITSFGDEFEEEQFSPEELSVVVTEAARRRRRVAAHAEALPAIRAALRAGVHSVEHGWFFDEESLDAMVRQGTWWIPTLALVSEGVARRREDPTWSAAQLSDEDRAEADILRRQEEQIPLWREAVRRRAKIAFGTDLSHRLLVGQSLVELKYLVDWLGLDPLAALTAATGDAARCLERDDIGTLQPGRAADLVLVDGDPLADIGLLADPRRVRLVLQGGRVVKDTLGLALT